MTVQDPVEDLFNTQEICAAIMEQNKPKATRLFDAKTSFFANVNCGNVDNCPNIELMSVFLNALNNAVYTSALSSFGCNLQGCCYSITKSLSDVTNLKTFSIKGEQLITTYCVAINAYIAENGRCQHRLYITKAKEYIDNNIENHFTLEDVANEIYISPAYLSHLFNNLTGTTYSSYVTSVRIDMAKKLLIATDKSINEIAIVSGFSQASYFATTFKKATGITPKQFRTSMSVAV